MTTRDALIIAPDIGYCELREILASNGGLPMNCKAFTTTGKTGLTSAVADRGWRRSKPTRFTRNTQ
jgi:hypothetical protein